LASIYPLGLFSFNVWFLRGVNERIIAKALTDAVYSSNVDIATGTSRPSQFSGWPVQRAFAGTKFKT
jgi:hypothetical protein